MYWTSPLGAFTAVNPPQWLQRDLQIAEAVPALRRMSTLVLLADQMPHHQQANQYDMTEPVFQARLSKLNEYVEHVFAASLTEMGFDPHMAGVNSGAADTDAWEDTDEYIHPESGVTHKQVTVTRRAMYGLVILAPSGEDLRRNLADDYGLRPQQLGEEVTAQALAREELWHELGHLVRDSSMPGPLDIRTEERLCDMFAQRGCRQVGDGLAASLVVPLRALDALASPLTSKAIRYWNALSMTQPQTDLTRELTAQLDVKARALGVADTFTATSLNLWAALNGPEGKFLHNAYQLPRQFEQRLRTLQELDRTQAYPSEDSRKLAKLTLAAAARLLPRLVSD